MNAILSPSLLSANFAALGEECAALEGADISWLHLDVMDGVFVPNITFGAPVISALRHASGLFFDAHLMIMEPERHIEALAKAGCDLLAPHIEAMRHPQKTLAAIHKLGARAGVALNPDTNIDRLRWLLPDIDMVLIMGVNPGFSGQKFLPQTVEKIRRCRQYLDEHGYAQIPIEVDGGAEPGNAAALCGAGASIVVSGSAFFRHASHAAGRAAFARAFADCPGAALAPLAFARSFHSFYAQNKGKCHAQPS